MPLCAFLLLLFIVGPCAFAGQADLLEWRKQAALLRREAMADAPQAYARALQWKDASGPNLSYADQALALNLLASIEDSLGRTDEAASHAACALELARTASSHLEQGRARLILAVQEEARGFPERALVATRDVVELLEKEGDSEVLMEALLQLTSLYYQVDDTEQAIVFSARASLLAERLNDPVWLAFAEIRTGWTLYQSSRYDEARRHGLEARDYAQGAGAKYLESMALQIAAASTGRGGNRPEAERLFRESLALIRACGMPGKVAACLHNLALNLRNQGKWDESLVYLDEALALLQKHPNKVHLARNMNVRADVLARMGRLAEALALAEQCHALSSNFPQSILSVEGIERLSETCSLAGDLSRAYSLARLASERRQALDRRRVDLRVAELSQAYASEQRQREIDRLTAQTNEQSILLRHHEEKQHLLLALVLIGLLALLLVITLIVKARDNAMALAKSRSLFLASMSHEIRTPMNGVVGLTDLLAGTKLTPEQSEMLRLLQASTHSLLTIINDILDFSKIEAGKLRIESIPVSPAGLVRDSAALFEARARERGLVLEWYSENGLEKPRLGDPVRMRQILDNFVGNALKFTERGSVRVSVKAASAGGDWLRFEVKDTGIGVPKNKRQAIFEAFEQSDPSHTRRFGGTGLGLAISARLAKLMHARIGVESEEGRGSLFWLELSMPPGDAAPSTVAPTLSSPVVSEKFARRQLRLLVAEDNSTNRFVLEHMLKGLSCTLTFATNGREALRLLERDSFDAVLMDCQMPELDGFEATRQIRSGVLPKIEPSVPIIALTAYALDSDCERCLAAGMNAYLSKPLRKADLLAALARCGLHCAPIASPEPPPAIEQEPSTPPSGLLDEDYLRSLIEVTGPGVDSLFVEMRTLFFQDFPPRLEALREACGNKDSSAAVELAHSLAGSAANISAVVLRTRCAELEGAARRKEWAQVDGLFSKLETTWVDTRRALEEWDEQGDSLTSR